MTPRLAGLACVLASASAAARPHAKHVDAAVREPNETTDTAPRAEQVDAAIALTKQPATRAEGIAELATLWRTAIDPHAARQALARALSWAGRLDEALEHYDALVGDDRSDDVQLALERLQVLEWKGRADDAEAGYLALADRHPDAIAAQLGVIRMRRWRGRIEPLHALAVARRAPDDKAAREEAANAYLALGLPYAARDAFAGDPPPGELDAQIARASQPQLATAVIASSDSFGVDRLSPRAKVTLPLPHGVAIELGGGSSHLRRSGGALDYGVAAAALSLATPRIALGVAAGLYAGSDASPGGEAGVPAEASAFVTLRAHDRLQLTLGARRRPFLEPSEPLATGETAFFSAGSGGATSTLAAVTQHSVDELRLAANAVPFLGSYVYLDGRLLKVSDGNTGQSGAAGAGIDVLALAGVTNVGLVARVDSFYLGYAAPRPEYFSPDQLDGHAISAQLVWRGRHVTLSAQGGATFSLTDNSGSGWMAGGGLDLSLGRFVLKARIERRDDIAYDARRGWLALNAAL